MKTKREPARPNYRVWVYDAFDGGGWSEAGRYHSERQAAAAARHIERTLGRRCRWGLVPA